MVFGARVRSSARLILLSFLVCSCFGAQDQTKSSPASQSWQVLREGLNDKRFSRRLEAVKALSLITHNRTAQKLAVAALHDENSKVRTAAAATLGQVHATSAIPSLKEALSDKEPSVMLAAAYSLFLLKDKSAYSIYYAILMGDKKTSEGMIQAQLDRLKDPKQMAVMGVQEGLGFVPYGGMGIEAYRQLSKKDTSPVRASAARFLAHDPDPISEDALLQSALADKSDIVREAALDALAERGDPKCVERLMQNLKDDKTAVRYRTAALIIHLSSVKNPRKSRGQHDGGI